MDIVKTKSFDKNLKRNRSVRGLLTKVTETLDNLKNNIMGDVKILTGNKFPRGTMSVRINDYRLLYNIISNKRVVVGFVKRDRVYDNAHANEFVQKVKEAQNMKIND